MAGPTMSPPTSTTALTTLTEDDIYRQSSQYRLWSFSPGSLAAARQANISAAAARVEAVLKHPIDPLTVSEELLLVRKNCQRAIDLIDFLKITLATPVKTSAVQFLKRFYITASCMEYPPSKMVASAVFLGAKSNGIVLELAEFAQKSGRTEQAITAPEFKLAQGNRFAFDVRTPVRACEGGFMMLLEIGHGEAPVPAAAELQDEMLELYGAKWEDKVGAAIQPVRDTLKTSALLSDAYLLYTPPQVWLGALWNIDERLARLYLKCALLGASNEQRESVIVEVKGCAELLLKDAELSKLADDAERIKRLNQKLKHCTNPETSDLIELNAAQKRDPDPTSANGHASKKLKTEHGQIEDPFGPAISKPDPK